MRNYSGASPSRVTYTRLDATSIPVDEAVLLCIGVDGVHFPSQFGLNDRS
jgi:hypothetical protein